MAHVTVFLYTTAAIRRFATSHRLPSTVRHIFLTDCAFYTKTDGDARRRRDNRGDGSMIWLLQIPAPIVGSLTVIVVVGLSILGLLVFRRLVSSTRLESAHTPSGEVFFSLAGVLYAVLGAFYVWVWGVECVDA